MVYPISIDHIGNRGILKKMEYQSTAFSELVGEVDVVCSSRRGPIANGELLADYPLTGPGFNSINHYGLFYSHIGKLVSAKPYDYLYIRYPLALPSFLAFLSKARKANPKSKIVAEIATFPYRWEFDTPKRRVLLMLDDLGRGQLKKYLDRIVTFYGQSEIFGVPCIQLSNGVDVDRIPLRRGRSSDGGFSIIAVGNLAERHGLDRALRGLASFVHQPEASRVTLHFVGDGPAVPGLTALTSDLGLDAFVRFHGTMHGVELDALFDRVDIALDSLGVHRLGLPCSSSLKAREYCARGVPFVIASDDPDFPPDLPFVHRVPTNDAPIDMQALLQFCANVRGAHAQLGRQMRAYAARELTWQAKLAPVVDYLRRDSSNGTPTSSSAG